MRTKIEYKGETLAFTEGSVIELHCKGKKMVDNLTISVYDDGSGGGDPGEEKPTLPPPTIAIEGDILTITDESGLALSFDILVDGEKKAETKAVHELEYTLSGKWAFNPAPKKPSFEKYEIPFQSTGMDGTKTYVAMTFSSQLIYGNTGSIGTQAYTWDAWWDEYASRVIDFGSTPRIVSREFYEWFTANATEARTLNAGGWVFKETPTLEETAARVYVSFTVTHKGGTTTERIFIEVNDIAITSGRLGFTETCYNRAVGGWNETYDYRHINFATSQAVPADFYDWFVANAYRELSGTWTFKEKVTLPDAAISEKINGIQFGDVSAYTVTVTPDRLRINAASEGEDWYILHYAGLWTHSKYRTATIAKPVDVTDGFYTWFTANASLTE